MGPLKHACTGSMYACVRSMRACIGFMDDKHREHVRMRWMHSNSEKHPRKGKSVNLSTNHALCELPLRPFSRIRERCSSCVLLGALGVSLTLGDVLLTSGRAPPSAWVPGG